MLKLREQIGTFDGITFYADFDDPNQFWYIPQDINFAVKENGEVNFTMIAFAGDDSALDGAYVNFEVNMAVKDSKKNAAFQQYLNSIGYQGTPSLALVPFDSGSVNFVVLEGKNNTLGKMVEMQSPSLIGDNSAIFGAKLDAMQAQIAEALFSEAAAPAAVYYSLTYTGIVPSLSIRVIANFESIYTSLDAKFGASVISLDPPINFYLGFNAVFKKLMTDGDLVIQIVEGKNPSEKDKEWVLDFVKLEILKSFFNATIDVNTDNNDQAAPSSESLLSNLFDMLKKEEKKDGAGNGTENRENTANANEGASEGGGALPIPALSLQVKLVRIEEAKRFNLNFDVARAVQQTIAPQSFLGTETIRMKKEAPYFLKKKLDDPFFAKIPLNVIGPDTFDDIGLVAASATMDFEGRRIATPLFKKGGEKSWTKEISRMENLDTPIAVTKSYVYGTAATTNILGKTEYSVAANTLSNLISLQPLDTILTVDIPILPFLVDFDVYPLVEVSITYAEPLQMQAEKNYQFYKDKRDSQNFKYRMEKEFPWKIAYQIKYTDKQGYKHTIDSIPGAPVDTILIPANPPKDDA